MLSNLLVSPRNCGAKVKCKSRKAISDFALPLHLCVKLFTSLLFLLSSCHSNHQPNMES